MNYKDFDKDYSQSRMELDVIKFWEDSDIFKKVQKHYKDADPFIFYEGPPTANGKPGVHHVMSRTIKDVVCRYKTMKGFFVDRKGGWDTHGLPVELEVEKKLGLDDKKKIEAYGIDKFNAACRDSVFTYLKDWEETTRRIGYWLDMDNPYVTCHNEYIESVWWLLSQYFNKDMIYKGHRIVPYCPRCGTALSDHEVAQGYKEVEDPSIYVRFKIPSMENTYFLVWTTTPWTLLSNVAVALHPDLEYVKIEHEGKYLILVKERAKALFGEEISFIETYKGNELSGIDYEPLFTFEQVDKKAWYSINADYVTVEDGTGIVHIAPAFGQEDYEQGKAHDLPFVQLVTEEGKIPEKVTPFANLFIKDADPLIIEDLKKRGLLLASGKIKHTYPFCWRCKSPLLYFARGSWYIRTTDYKQQMLEANDKVQWIPPTIGSGRFGEWLRNNIDWAISRERYWGTPLNIWVCEDCGKMKSIGTIKQLQEEAIEEVADDIDLHRPYVDYIHLKCDCGSQMTRTPEVIDCWFDSGSMPFSQHHYPSADKEHFDKALFPADFISEGVDQTRGWFYTLLAISTFIKGESPYKTCVVVGLLLDAEGRKMSKSLNNSIAPAEFWNKWGADPLRWFLMSNSQPWLPTRIEVDSVGEVSSKVFDTMRNIYKFFITYANIDNFEYKELPENDLSILDKWVLSKLNTLSKRIDQLLSEYDMTRAAREIAAFILDDVSNWYVRRSRRRFWGSDENEIERKDKNAAYHTLYKVLIECTKLMAPFAPMTADAYYNNLNGPLETVHLEAFPIGDEKYIDEELEKQMETVLMLANLGRAVRNKAKIRVRQPLRTVFTKGLDVKLNNDVLDLIKDELNIKNIEDATGQNFTKLTAKANFRTLGKKLGKNVNIMAKFITELDNDILIKFDNGENVTVNVDTLGEFELEPDDVLLTREDDPAYVTVAEADITVAVSTHIDDDLLLEGMARELVNRIQNSRKNADFEVTDRIELAVEADEFIISTLNSMKEYIMSETLTEKISTSVEGDFEYKEEWTIDDRKLILYLTRVKK